MHLFRPCLSLIPLALAGCAIAPPVPRLTPPALAHGGHAPAVDALLADFYGVGLPPDEAWRRALEVLRESPANAAAHEVAALAATLRSDGDAAFEHFLAAAADLDGDAPDYDLSELAVHDRAQEDAKVAVLEALRAQHRRPDVRALATFELAATQRRLGRFAAADALIASLQPIAAWQVLGALDNDQGKGFWNKLAAEHEPSKAIEGQTPVPGLLVPVRWRPVERLSPLGEVPLGDMLHPHEFAVAYLATWVHVDRAVAAQVRVRTGSPTRIFVNDRDVLSEESLVRGRFDNLIAPVHLHAGWNQLVVQSANRRASWKLLARLTDATGAPLAGVTIDPTPHAYARYDGQGGASIAEPSYFGPAGRRAFLVSRQLHHGGRARQALTELQPFLDAQPDNPLAWYYGARELSDNDEGGKAIDLLDRGVQHLGGKAPGFYEARGRYYQRKELWEKAQTDLTAAIAAQPTSVWAQRALVELFAQRRWQVDREQQLRRMLAQHPDDGWARRELGDALDMLGFQAQARRAYQVALALQPGGVEILERLARVAFRSDKLAEARRLLAQVQRLDPTDPAWVVEEGDVLRREGRAERAAERYRRAAAMAPELPRPWDRLGQLAYERGQREQALTWWKKARERDPNDTSLAQHLEYLEPVRLGFVDKLIPGEVEIDRAVHKQVKASPNAQSAMLLDHLVEEVNADGSSRRVVTEVSLALDEKGRDALTQQRVPTHGTVRILRAYAVTDKGEQQTASSIRPGEVRFRNLVVGSRTVLQYIHYAPPPHFLPGAFVGQWFFQAVNVQNEDSTWVLVLDKGRTLHVQKAGAVDDTSRVDGDRLIRTFHGEHHLPIAQEQHMPPVIDLVAHVEVSTVQGWDDYVRWERALLADAFRSNPALDALVDRLVEGAKTPRDKLDRLFHHVNQQIRYQQDYENTIAGVRPHAAPSVIERGYGDCKDKSVLLIEMARRVGIKVWFAILRNTPAGKVAQEVPNQQFNHAIVYVPKQPGFDEPLFLDPTSDGLDMGNLRSDDQGANSLVLDPESGAWSFVAIPHQAPEMTYERHEVTLEVKTPTEAVIKDKMSLRGVTAMGLRHVLRNEGNASKVYAAIAAALFSGATVRNAVSGSKEDIWHPLVLSLDVDASQSLLPEEEHYRLKLPGRFVLSTVVAQKTRETPMWMGPPDSSSYDVEATLPEGYAVTHAPKDFAVKHDCFSLSRSARVEARKVSVKLDYVRRCTELSVADYVAFRVAVQDAARRLDDDLVFARAAPTRKSKK